MAKDYIKAMNEKAERRFFASEVRAVKPAPMDPEDATEVFPIISGYAAKFNSDTTIGCYFKFIERIAPGAFDDVLNDDVRCLFNHDPNFVLARSINGTGTLKLEVDNVGLKYTYTTPDRSYAEDLANAIALGDVSQSSFAFEIAEEMWMYGENEGDLDTRIISKFKKLYDVSPVTYPAYQDTEVAEESRSAAIKNIEVRETSNPKELSSFEAQIIINSNF